MLTAPQASSIVPEKVSLTVDARHPDPDARALLYARHETLMREVAARRDLEIDWEIVGDDPPCVCDPPTVRLLEDVARDLSIPFLTMASGAVHDAQQMAAMCKVAMIFVQSKDGRSPTPAEFTAREHAVTGIEVLAEGLHRLASKTR